MIQILTFLLILCALNCDAQVNQPRLLKFKGFKGLWLPGSTPALDGGDVLSHWKMNEATGNARVDSADSKNLEEHGGVPSATGKIGDAADFSGGGAFISPASFYTITNTSFTLCGWVYMNSHGAGQTPVGTLTPGLVLESDGTSLRFGVSSNAATISTYVTSTVPITNAAWIFVACIFDKTGKTIGISCNNETIVTASHGGGVADSVDIRFGISTSATYLDGRDDSFSWFRRAISQSDVARLYNGGAGRDYPFDTASFPSGATHYWKMDETSGSRSDSIGSLTLTERDGPVGFVPGMKNNAAFLDWSVSMPNGISGMDSSAIVLPSEYSVSLWFFAIHTNDVNSVGLIAHDGDSSQAQFWMDRNELFWDNGFDQLHVAYVSTGAWHHVVGTMTGTTAKAAYDGGAFVTSLIAVYTAQSAPITFGDEPVGGTLALDGYIDEVGLWERALTAQEATDLWNGGLGTFGP